MSKLICYPIQTGKTLVFKNALSEVCILLLSIFVEAQVSLPFSRAVTFNSFAMWFCRPSIAFGLRSMYYEFHHNKHIDFNIN